MAKKATAETRRAQRMGKTEKDCTDKEKANPLNPPCQGDFKKKRRRIKGLDCLNQGSPDLRICRIKDFVGGASPDSACPDAFCGRGKHLWEEQTSVGGASLPRFRKPATEKPVQG